MGVLDPGGWFGFVIYSVSGLGGFVVNVRGGSKILTQQVKDGCEDVECIYW